jgi:hypothetical protein
MLPWHPQVVERYRNEEHPLVVNTLLASGDTLYVGGNFRRIAGKPRLSIAAFSLPSLRLAAWDPAARGDAMFEGVKAFAVDHGVVYVAGDFDSINDVIRKDGVGAVDAVSAQTLPWNPPSADVGVPYALAVADDTVFIGGNPSLGTVVLAAVDNDNGRRTKWAVDNETSVGVSEPRELVPIGDSLYAAGTYLPVDAVARFDPGDGRPLPLSLHVDSLHPVDAMVGSGTNVYIVKAGRIAVVEAKTGRFRRWIRACPVDPEFVPRLAVTEARAIVTCPAAGGSAAGDRLTVLKLKNQP